ncbi:MAG: FmdB family transcriptional regulator [Treponema sp.]|jgi:putative FmdB family regulatory protein|nr:FmdB family transcriptional regulator [Treponema sp.]
MPTYEYECESCAHRFEAFQKMNDAPLTNCPLCNQKVRRILSGGIGISFQGAGFYVTDSKKPEKAEKPAADKADKKQPSPACPGGCPHCEKAAS